MATAEDKKYIKSFGYDVNKLSGAQMDAMMLSADTAAFYWEWAHAGVNDDDDTEVNGMTCAKQSRISKDYCQYFGSERESIAAHMEGAVS